MGLLPPTPHRALALIPCVAVLQRVQGEKELLESSREQSLSIHRAWCTRAALGAGTTCMGWAAMSASQRPSSCSPCRPHGELNGLPFTVSTE